MLRLLLLLWVLSLRIFDKDSILIVLRLLWLVCIFWYDRGTVLLVLSVVDEEVVLLSIDDSFNKFSSMVSFSLQDGDDDIHDLWTKTWESEENLLDDRVSKVLKLSIDILDKLEGWLTELVELWSNQVVEHIDGWESWNLVTLVHGDSSLNSHVRVFLSSTVILVL